ncbi:circadian clock KaiB family protein [Legionella maioricensis]|uniref:Circadian clock KaiB family protein n=1 Tax=Legionella maioricensis TaxID=2896528 RepID=A0A9X2IBB7_9GAMM|nr:circadian clock KaiB family protein [Legionella maioricensis]MCL9683242.1 circadian clock KaiB family protein [Legionella maioricensis]MCL9686060.1 circadian clock KaiB family protein [Legionella maioricensis]
MNKGKTKNSKLKKKSAVSGKEKWVFNLYIAGGTPHCMLTLDNLKKFCNEYLPDSYAIEVIDLLQHPEYAQSAEIIAIPTVIKFKPDPVRYIIGDFSNSKLMLMKLGLDMNPKTIEASNKSEQPFPPFQ